MGNSRLGVLLKTRLWRQVVWLISDDASAPEIAAATWEAAQREIDKASRDPSFTLAFYLVADLAHSARRLLELKDERAEAEEMQNRIRISKIDDEINDLEKYLNSGTNRSGRSRQLHSGAEKARKSVKRSVDYAIKKIKKRHSQLAQHLRTSIITGTFCSYKPSQSIPWILA